jgi:hypothetical protein
MEDESITDRILGIELSDEHNSSTAGTTTDMGSGP